MEKSRTKNTVRNFSSGAVVQIINKLMAFVVRTIFIKVLGTEYLGVNGLFTNILTVLSFAELGFGTAIIYNMYKPVANGDKEKIKSLMKLYKKVYTTIGIIVGILGMALIPFLKYIITNPPDIPENLIAIYILFLTNTVSSYFITYKKSIISAYQQESIINKYSSICYIIKSILEIIFLVLTKNYIIYLAIEIGCTIIQNIAVSVKAEKMFPYLKDKNVKGIDSNEKKTIFSNVKALALYRFAGTILNGTDNIIISSLFGVNIVGICSNYTLIISSVTAIIEAAINSIIASIGNLNTSKDYKKSEKVFYQLLFITYIIYNFCAVSILILINPFIELWIGKEYLINSLVVFAMGLSMYVEGTRFAGYIFRNTYGLFVKGKYVPVISAILNILLSIILGKIIGISGVFFATAISRLVTNIWFDPYLIHKYKFNTNVIKFFKKYMLYAIVFLLNFMICYIITKGIANTIVGFVIRSIIVLVIPNSSVLLFFGRNEETKEIKERGLKFVQEKLGNNM